jgi:hypothetical protein
MEFFSCCFDQGTPIFIFIYWDQQILELTLDRGHLKFYWLGQENDLGSKGFV